MLLEGTQAYIDKLTAGAVLSYCSHIPTGALVSYLDGVMTTQIVCMECGKRLNKFETNVAIAELCRSPSSFAAKPLFKRSMFGDVEVICSKVVPVARAYMASGPDVVAIDN